MSLVTATLKWSTGLYIMQYQLPIASSRCVSASLQSYKKNGRLVYNIIVYITYPHFPPYYQPTKITVKCYCVTSWCCIHIIMIVYFIQIYSKYCVIADTHTSPLRFLPDDCDICVNVNCVRNIQWVRQAYKSTSCNRWIEQTISVQPV